MAEVEQGKFACSGCGKQYRWKPELASKKAKCKCGTVMDVPAEAPGGIDDDLYDLAPDESAPKRVQPVASAAAPAGGGRDEQYRCPSCKQGITPGSVICVHCGFNLREGKKVAATAAPRVVAPGRGPVAAAPARPGVLPYGARPAPAGRDALSIEDRVGGELWQELYLPIGLLLLGFFLQIGIAMYEGDGQWHSFGDALPMIAVRLGVNLVLSFIGIMVVAKLMEVSFGAIGPAVIKIAAICLLVPSLSYLGGALIGAGDGFVHMMIASTLTFPLGIVAFKLLFDLDFGDAIYCVIIISLVNDWAMLFIMGMMFSAI